MYRILHTSGDVANGDQTVANWRLHVVPADAGT
eukprot:COSAG02_NODE_179_length_31090_cov_49.813785_16_plen_33_part_00